MITQTHVLPYDLCLKSVKCNEETLWLLFRSGEMQTPILVLHETTIEAMADAVEAEQEERRHERTR